jgi:uncharacterized protein (TIGR02118 family)
MARRLVFLLRRLPSLTREEFQDYWLGTHAPLVAERAGVLGIRRYQQVHTTRQVRPDTTAAFDGIAELWIEPSTATGSASAGADGRRRAGDELLADERNFIDLSSSPIWMAEEVLLKEGPIEGERMTAALRRAPGLTRAEFLDHWRQVHGPLALQHPEVFGFRHYVQLHTPLDAEDFPPAHARGAPAPFDGISEIYRDEPIADPEHLAAVREMIMEDEARFVDYGTSPVWYGRVEVILS